MRLNNKEILFNEIQLFSVRQFCRDLHILRSMGLTGSYNDAT